ncbi:hypothetical protein QYE76_023690 [Lolium multiflorum]|uniref:Uncharacterized protein n=1 Tax=Lolium multiflorum TaxID=4521 RepID=A0AAD8RAQ7_LOLMU|nr:hypothetical protein QYE76_023690 [Lolium multiflorum]
MPPRARLTKHTAAGTDAAIEGAKIHGWERSKLTNQDKKSLKKLGLVQRDSLIFPGDESAPKPPMGYRIMSHPHWGLWKRIFYLRRNNSRNVVYNIGGVCICVRSDVDYFDVKFPDSVQGWRKKWLYIQDKTIGGQEYGIAPFDSAAEILSGEKEEEEEELAVIGTAPRSTSNTVILSEENLGTADSLPPPQQNMDTSTPPPSPQAPSPKIQKLGAGNEQTLVLGSSSTPLMNDPIMYQFIRLGSQFIGFRDEADTLRASLQRAEERAEALEAKLKVSEEAREKAQAEAASVEELRQRLSKVESALSDKITEQIAREQGIIDRLEAQTRCFFRRNDERFELLEPKDDRLLDALFILELQGDLARTNLDESRAAFSRLFPHFFPKETEPEIFAALVKRFLSKEDLALAYRR